MRKSLAALVVCTSVFTVNLIAQSRGPQRMQVLMGNVARPDLNSTLMDLERISMATQNDISNLHVENWKAGWKTGFLKSGSHKGEAQQAAGSLQRNLANALPGFIRDVQNSHGGVSATFRLYDDISLVCEALDSLISASEAAGKKSDAAPLEQDYSALTRVRRSLSTYVQQSASVLETKGKTPSINFITPATPLAQTRPATQLAQTRPAAQRSSASTQIVTDQGVKKIIIDDTIPEKSPAPAPAAKKKAAVTYSNL
jgi:hypothetical protein